MAAESPGDFWIWFVMLAVAPAIVLSLIFVIGIGPAVIAMLWINFLPESILGDHTLGRRESSFPPS